MESDFGLRRENKSNSGEKGAGREKLGREHVVNKLQ
jgi:hypothetical protein